MDAMMIPGFFYRAFVSLTEASPFVLAGLMTTAVLRTFFGTAGTRRLFGEGTRSALLRAWLLGMLLPVCSLGVIPVVRELRRARIRGGTVLAFAMSGPLFNPLSLLYGLTLSEPVAILTFAFCSLIIVTAAGLVYDWLFPEHCEEPVAEPVVAFGLQRMAALFSVTVREASGASGGWLLLGLCGVGVLGAVLPQNSLQHSFNADNAMAPLLMMLLSIPVYATPMLAMSQLGMMFQHANSVGAAFILLILGAGTNPGLIGWSVAEFGWKRAAGWLLLVLVVLLPLAYGVQDPLFPTDVEPAGHTHAFDIYCRPFSGNEPNPLQALRDRLSRDLAPWQYRPLMLVGLLAAAGVVLRVADRRGRLEAWIRKPVPTRPAGRFDLVIPPSVLGALSLSGLVVLSVAGCYAAYPAPAESLDAMTDARIGALSAALSLDHAETKYWSERYDDWTRRMEVGAWLRRGSLSDYHRWKTRIVREKLELLEHEVEEGDRELVLKLVSEITRAHRRMSEAYRNELTDAW
jgi:uncharacterized membrane protein YraQ (UPF0718 family)